MLHVLHLPARRPAFRVAAEPPGVDFESAADDVERIAECDVDIVVRRIRNRPLLVARGRSVARAQGRLVIDNQRTVRNAEFDVDRILAAVPVMLVRCGDHDMAVRDALEMALELLGFLHDVVGDGRGRTHVAKCRLHREGRGRGGNRRFGIGRVVW